MRNAYLNMYINKYFLLQICLPLHHQSFIFFFTVLSINIYKNKYFTFLFCSLCIIPVCKTFYLCNSLTLH